jgi:high-affinity nickel permease
MFVLGLRHGPDPDHIACIDGLTWRTIDHDKRLAARLIFTPGMLITDTLDGRLLCRIAMQLGLLSPPFGLLVFTMR